MGANGFGLYDMSGNVWEWGELLVWPELSPEKPSQAQRDQRAETCVLCVAGLGVSAPKSSGIYNNAVHALEPRGAPTKNITYPRNPPHYSRTRNEWDSYLANWLSVSAAASSGKDT